MENFVTQNQIDKIVCVKNIFETFYEGVQYSKYP